MGRLHEYFLNNSGRTIYKRASYFDVYEQHFGRFEGQDITFLEIGVGEGGSSAMWKDYFGPNARILTLDIREDRKFVEDTVTKFYCGSQIDHALLQQIVDEYGPLDIVLDDGSHIMSHMIDTFEFLYPTVNPYGVYMIEDLACSYQSRFEGGYRRPGTIIEYTKDLLDRLHLANAAEEGAPEPDDFTMSTHSISVYDGIVAFERRPKPQPQSITTAGYPRLGKRPVMPSTLDMFSPNRVKGAKRNRRGRGTS